MVNPAADLACGHTILAKHPLAFYGCDVVTSASGTLALFGTAGVPSFSCTNTKADFTYRWSFGLHPGATGEQAGWAKFVCTMKNVKRTVLFGQDQAGAAQGLDRGDPAGGPGLRQGRSMLCSFPRGPRNRLHPVRPAGSCWSKKPDFVFLSQSAAQTASIREAVQSRTASPADLG